MNSSAVVSIIAALFSLLVSGVIILFLFIIPAWKIFTKAGQPGWGCLIPIYNVYLWIKIAGRPGWWLLLLLIPCVNLVVQFIVAIDVAKNFGKGTGFGILLALLPVIGFPILGYGSAVYTRPPGA
jgi:hypothetical protein